MSGEYIKATMQLSFRIGRPDLNDVTYSKEAVAKALMHKTVGIPIITRQKDGKERIVGLVTSDPHDIVVDRKAGIISTEVDGLLYSRGTAETLPRENENGDVVDFHICAVYISD